MIIIKCICAMVLFIFRTVAAMVLCVMEAMFCFSTGLLKKIGGFIGGLFTISSILCLATGIVSVNEFWPMFLGGIIIGSIPLIIRSFGFHVITILKMFL